jgi:hypothetical protein
MDIDSATEKYTHPDKEDGEKFGSLNELVPKESFYSYQYFTKEGFRAFNLSILTRAIG